MNAYDIAAEMIKRFEGFHRVVRRHNEVFAAPYICPAGYWTIGYGHLCRADQEPITEEQADRLLRVDMQKAIDAVARLCPVGMSGNQRAALIDFTFNLGAGRLQTSTLRRRVLEENWREAQYEIRRWVYGGGRILPGLVVRRAEESRLLKP